MSNTSEKRYWFYAKEYGWGWGLPATWEGWVVFGAYLALIPMGLALADPSRHPGLFTGYMVLLSAGLVAVCWLTGEPPAWRWGGVTNSSHATNPRYWPVFHLFLGPMLLAIAILFRTHLPAETNHTYGYRTALSMSSQMTWDEAQRYSANAFLVVGAITVLYQIASGLLMKPAVSLISSAIVMVLLVMATVPITEGHLHHFLGSHGGTPVHSSGP